MGIEQGGPSFEVGATNEAYENIGGREVKLSEEETSELTDEADSRNESLLTSKIDTAKELNQINTLDVSIKNSIISLRVIRQNLGLESSEDNNFENVPESIRSQILEAENMVDELKAKLDQIAASLRTEQELANKHFSTVSGEIGLGRLGRPRPASDSLEKDPAE